MTDKHDGAFKNRNSELYIFITDRVNSSRREKYCQRTLKSSTSSEISTNSMQLILKKLKSQSNQKSTVNNYLGIWHRFNDFIMKLNELPKD